MKWLWITALLFLVTGVKSGPTRNDGDPAVEGTIVKIERTAKRSATASEQFKFTLSKIPVNDITMVLLGVIESGTKIEEFYAIDTAPAIPPTFEADLTDYSGKSLNFLTEAKNEALDTLAFATVDMTPFPHFPGETKTTTLLDPRPLQSGPLVRVEGSLGDMSLTSSETLFKGDINYFAFPGPANYNPCINSNGVNVCDRELETSVPKCTIDDDIVDSAVLAHGSKDSATIKLTFHNNAVTHEAILIPQAPQSPEENVLCTDAEFTGPTCIIKWSDPSSAVLQLIIIQKTTGQDPDPDTWVTSTFDIHDRALVATKLGTNIIEGRWNILDVDVPNNGVTHEDPHYQMILNGNTVSPISVDCSHLVESKLCFGYFPDVSDGTYTLTVVPENGTALQDQIESSQVKIELSRPELEILSRHTTTHQNQQRADVQICFQHRTQTEGRPFSHYEMLIINEKGQWLKHSLMQEEEEGGDASGERLCFAPFTINTTDFALTEATRVVVSQRAVDGISVLASGESALF